MASMNRVTDTLVGMCLSGLGDIALSSWGAYRMLYAPALTGGLPTGGGAARAYAAYAFWNAGRRVPAYREFLRTAGALRPRRFDEIPPMDKDSYIRRFPLEELCQGGRLPERGAVLDESSGSTGTATNWVRGKDERHATRRLIQYSARATFGGDGFVLLNAFALGPWATGLNVSMSLVDRCLLKSIGPDARKLIATLKLLGPKYRYVITGYPPFLKALVRSTADIDWRQYDICAVVGGEGMSEALRAALGRAFRKTVSSFGASDLEINMAVETDFTVAVRQAVAASPALGRDLFGEHEGLPMIFQYDPLNYLVESDSDRNLLFTVNRMENVSPRIRYNIHDRGMVRPLADVLRVLRDHEAMPGGPAPRVNLPLMFHWGRQEHAVAFYGCKITPEDVQNVVLRMPALRDRVADFALHPHEDANANKRLELWFEMKAGVDIPDAGPLVEGLLVELADVNQDFRESIKMVRVEHRPTIRMFEHGSSPLSGQDLRIKKRYILKVLAEQSLCQHTTSWFHGSTSALTSASIAARILSSASYRRPDRTGAPPPSSIVPEAFELLPALDDPRGSARAGVVRNSGWVEVPPDDRGIDGGLPRAKPDVRQRVAGARSAWKDGPRATPLKALRSRRRRRWRSRSPSSSRPGRRQSR